MRAIVRSLESIGEATQTLPATCRTRHPCISWGKMAGMRDVLIHACFRVDYAIVWDVCTQKIPALLTQSRL